MKLSSASAPATGGFAEEADVRQAMWDTGGERRTGESSEGSEMSVTGSANGADVSADAVVSVTRLIRGE